MCLLSHRVSLRPRGHGGKTKCAEQLRRELLPKKDGVERGRAEQDRAGSKRIPDAAAEMARPRYTPLRFERVPGGRPAWRRAGRFSFFFLVFSCPSRACFALSALRPVIPLLVSLLYPLLLLTSNLQPNPQPTLAPSYKLGHGRMGKDRPCRVVPASAAEAEAKALGSAEGGGVVERGRKSKRVGRSIHQPWMIGDDGCMDGWHR